MNKKLSNNSKRNERYCSFLEACRAGTATVDDIVTLGHKVMRANRLHHHFLGKYSFFSGFPLSYNAEHLAKHVLKKRNKPIGGAERDKLTEEVAIEILKLFERRIVERIPAEYITHEADYLGHEFYVNEHVLVPRSLMNYHFSDFLNEVSWKNNRVLDLCTGSGCIGITLALMAPDIQVDLVDISPEALDVARTNVKKHALENRVRCIQSDCFENVSGKYDLIISNPPYVSLRDYHACPDEFFNEPKLALVSGEDGLALVERMLMQAKDYLNPTGTLIVEVGASSAKLLKKKYPRVRFKWFKYRRPSGKESWLDDDCVFLCRWPQLRNL